MGKQRIKTHYLQGQNGKAVTRNVFMVEKKLTVRIVLCAEWAEKLLYACGRGCI